MRANELADALGGKRVGSSWVAPCPAHDDATPSLSITDGDYRLLVYCHGGCTQGAVIEALTQRGLWDDNRLPLGETPKKNFVQVRRDQQLEVVERIWGQTLPAADTLVQKYLHRRGLSGPIPQSIRFHPDLIHPHIGVTFPAMVVKIEDTDGALKGVQRTYFDRSIPTKASIAIPRLALGQLKGNAVRLGTSSATVLLGEGVETVLSGMEIFGLPGVAALSANLMASVRLTDEIKRVILLTDADDAGRRAVEETIQGCVVDGIEVIAIEPVNANDFNDALTAASPDFEF